MKTAQKMGSVAKRPDGKWRARYRDELGKEHSRHFARKIDAQRWLRQQEGALDKGLHIDPEAGKSTLEAFYSDWSKRRIWADGTRKAMNLAVSSCPFKGRELRQIKRAHVEQWVKDMDATLAPGTVRTRFNNVRSVLRGAVQDQKIVLDPTTGVKLPKGRRKEQAMVIPTAEQVAALIEAAEPQVKTYLMLCAFAGLRLGEASAVQWGDVDTDANVLHVRRQVQRANGSEVSLSLPKHGSERDVFIPESLVKVLSRHVTDNGVRGDEQWLFVGQGGNPPHQNTAGYWWRTTAERVGVSGFTLHSLRHFYASGLIAAGCSVVTVQKALGHSKASITLDTYSHLWPTNADETRTAAEGLMSAALPNFAD